MSILGIHHLTAVCSNARQTVSFYSQVLGLRLVKQTVNFDDPGAYHLYFGDDKGTPGTIITFFEWAHLKKGHWGIGTTHHLAFCVESEEAQKKWKRWLQQHGIRVSGPYNRTYFQSIYFTDPDGLILEIATRLPGWTVDEQADQLGKQRITPEQSYTKAGRDEVSIANVMWDQPIDALTPDMNIAGLHHITAIASDINLTTEFYTNVLEMNVVKRTLNYDDPSAPHYYFGVGEGKPGTIITYFGYPPTAMRYGQIGVGMTHHFAFAVENEEVQLEWRHKLMEIGLQVSPVMERVYFKSIYFNDPDGHILEIATLNPGFHVDEEIESLGTKLKLPKWLEPNRKIIEKSLEPIKL